VWVTPSLVHKISLFQTILVHLPGFKYRTETNCFFLATCLFPSLIVSMKDTKKIIFSHNFPKSKSDMKTVWKVNWLTCHYCGAKKNSESLTGIESMTFLTPTGTLYPLSYDNSWRARSCHWINMWQASCILLGSVLSNSSWVVMQWKWIKMVNFKPGDEMWKVIESLKFTILIHSLEFFSVVLINVIYLFYVIFFILLTLQVETEYQLTTQLVFDIQWELIWPL